MEGDDQSVDEEEADTSQSVSNNLTVYVHTHNLGDILCSAEMLLLAIMVELCIVITG